MFPARSPIRVLRVFGEPRRISGFTLIELLVVIVIIGILAGITLSVSAGARERAARERARAELAVLSVGLEEYRRVYGAYPSTDDGSALLASLAGKRRPDGAADSRRAFVMLSALTLRDADPDLVGNVLLDPWDQPYAYHVFQNGPRAGYRLYSIGPDGADQPPTANGALDEEAVVNRDNIYAHR